MPNSEIKFGLRKINAAQFATIDSVKVNEDSIDLNLGFMFGVDETTRFVECDFNVEIRSSKQAFIKINVSCVFEMVQEFWDSMMDIENNSICLPLVLVTHLATITVGTTRGILHSKTENTQFNKFFLPTVDVTQILTDDIIIELNEY